MPIHVHTDLLPPTEGAFKSICYGAMEHVYGVHNEYGSLFSEKLYKHEIADECRKGGFSCVQTEVPVEVTFREFRKFYYLDLLVEAGVLFELKCVSALTDEHRAQTLNYLFLTGLQRAKLANLGSASVEHEFVSTTLTQAERRRFDVNADRYSAIDEESSWFLDTLVAMLKDWGCLLVISLYREAITQLLGGEEKVVQAIPVVRNGREVTAQRAHLLNGHTAFKITAAGRHLDSIEEHLRRFLAHTNLKAIQWANLHRHNITFTTLLNTERVQGD